MKRSIGKVCWAGVLAVVAAAIPTPAFAATGTINVTSLADVDAVNGACTLREAIIAANNGASYHDCSHPGTANINIDLLPGTITLTSRLPASTSRPKTVRGKGAIATVIYGNGNQGMLVTSSSISFLDLTLDNFSSSALNISAGASASVDHVLIHASGSSGSGGGGCLSNSGALGVYYSQLEKCQAFEGAAISTQAGSNTIITNSTVLKSESEHGVIFNRGTMSFLSSTMGANRTGVSSGGICNAGGSVTIDSSTLAYSNHYLAGDVANELNNQSGSMHVKNSIIFSDPTAAGPDCAGTITSDGNNAYRSGAGCNFASSGDRAVTDPQLQPGGTEETFAHVPTFAGGLGRVYVPASTSPIVNQIAGSIAGADQRGVHRKPQVPFAPGPTGSDIGAVQRGIALLVVGNTSLSIGDTLIKNLLTKDGFTVTVKSDTAVTAADANGWTVVVISESVTSANVNTKFRSATSGVLVNESALFDDMNMTGTASDQYGTFNDTTINVERGSIGRNAGWLGPQAIAFFTISLAFGIPSSFQLPTFQGWRTGFPSQAMLFFYPKGMTMVGGFVAPGIRVGTCFTNAANGSLAHNGERFLEESILVAAGPIF